MDVMTASTGRALLVESRIDPQSMSELDYEFVLVLSRADYEEAALAGAQPILPSVRFSETDQRGALRRLLGPVNRAWRWRRYLLNEGITSVDARGLTPRSLTLWAGALLAGARFRVVK
jgi:hypothetical protein